MAVLKFNGCLKALKNVSKLSRKKQNCYSYLQTNLIEDEKYFSGKIEVWELFENCHFQNFLKVATKDTTFLQKEQNTIQAHGILSRLQFPTFGKE